MKNLEKKVQSIQQKWHEKNEDAWLDALTQGFTCTCSYEKLKKFINKKGIKHSKKCKAH